MSQSDGGSSPVGPSLHSLRIARAKWEFLFGMSPEDSTISGMKGSFIISVIGMDLAPCLTALSVLLALQCKCNPITLSHSTVTSVRCSGLEISKGGV